MIYADKYAGPRTVNAIVKHVESRFRRWDKTDVQQFVDEDSLFAHIDRTHRPVFVKAYEDWCQHCQKLIPVGG